MINASFAIGNTVPNSQEKSYQGELRFDEALAKYTSWRVGGPADRFYQPLDLEDLVTFVKTLPADESLFWIGHGSNLLVRDGGIRSTVIHTRGRLSRVEPRDHETVYAEAGASCAQVAKFCARNGLVGAEFLAGIPGTMGGALAMNAGAFDGETWDLVKGVVTLDRDGEHREFSPPVFDVGYRRVALDPDKWFLSALLKLQSGDAQESQLKIRNLLAKRAETQPTKVPSCGSVFRNPPGDYAARLIESCGLKDYCLGGAQVSEKHANFILNSGDASAADIEGLINHIQEVVEREHGVALQCEVRIVGALLENQA